MAHDEEKIIQSNHLKAEEGETKEMVVHTILAIYNQQGKKLRRFKTTALDGIKDMQDLKDLILKRYNISSPLDIRILDKYDGLVTLDQDYLNEYNPFGDENLNLNTVQSEKSLETTVKLRLFLPGMFLDQWVFFFSLAMIFLV